MKQLLCVSVTVPRPETFGQTLFIVTSITANTVYIKTLLRVPGIVYCDLHKYY